MWNSTPKWRRLGKGGSVLDGMRLCSRNAVIFITAIYLARPASRFGNKGRHA
jgi:hypothetical protein